MKHSRIYFLITCFLLISSMTHAQTISLDIDKSYIPAFFTFTTVGITIKGDFYDEHTVKIALSNVTTWPGAYMNDTGTLVSHYDLSIYSPDTADENVELNISRDRQTATAVITITPNDKANRIKTFYIDVGSLDYAAHCEISATLYNDNGNELATSEPATIPYDKNENKVADAWEHDAQFGGDLTSDNETGPNGNGSVGDGLTVFEEYRGFATQNGHVRTSPARKDIFIYSTSSVGLGYATNIEATHPDVFVMHRIHAHQRGFQGRINFRICNGYHIMNQASIYLRDATEAESDRNPNTYGHAVPIFPNNSPNIPAYMEEGVCFVDNLKKAIKNQKEKFGRPDTPLNEAVSKTIAHECAHHLHVNDDMLGTYNNPDGTATTAMSYTDYVDQKSGAFPANIHADEYRLK